MISVVMPAYNAEDFIAEAIESVLKQTYTEFEFIIVNDGSKDNTAQIVREFMKRDGRIHFIEKTNGGVSDALNVGINHAQFDWVAIVHADDMIAPERIQRQLEMAEKYPEVVIWGTGLYHVSSSSKILSAWHVGPTSIEECHKLRQQGEVIQAIHSTVLMKRDIVLKVGGYDSNFKVAEDIELFDRMLEYGPLVTIPDPLTYYRIHGSSLTMQNYAKQQKFVDYVVLRQRHRLQNLPPPTFDTLSEYYQNLSLWERFKGYQRIASGLNYRRAGMAYGEGDILKAIYFLTMSALIRPRHTIGRIWEQWLSPRLMGKTTKNNG